MKNTDCRTPTLYFWPIQKPSKLRSLRPWNTQIRRTAGFEPVLHGKEIVKGFLYVAVPVGLIVCKDHNHRLKGLESPCMIGEHKMVELPSSEFYVHFWIESPLLFCVFKFQFLLFDGLMLLVFLNFYSCAFYFWKKMSRKCFRYQVHDFSVHVTDAFVVMFFGSWLFRPCHWCFCCPVFS